MRASGPDKLILLQKDPFLDRLYEILKNFKDGKMNDGCVSVGILPINLSNVYQEIEQFLVDQDKKLVDSMMDANR